MAGQHLIFAEALVGLKKAVARYDDVAADEDDSAVDTARSVKCKLKRKAPRSCSMLDNSRLMHKMSSIEHAGYKRHILTRNPPLIDEDGDELECIVDDESADGSSAVDNPYGDIRLESAHAQSWLSNSHRLTGLLDLLAPLTSAADLATHPSMSIPYYSEHITQLSNNMRQALHREEKSLWRAKGIMQRLLGDDTWLPLGLMETCYDLEASNGSCFAATTSSASVESFNVDDTGCDGGGSMQRVSLADDRIVQEAPQDVLGQQAVPGVPCRDHHATTEDGGSAQMEPQHRIQQDGTEQNGNPEGKAVATGVVLGQCKSSESTEYSGNKIQYLVANGVGRYDKGAAHLEVGKETNSPEMPDNANSHDRRRANLQSCSGPSSGRVSLPESDHRAPIHPLFQFCVEKLVDRDMGLLPNEAEDTRTWLLIYIQKQEEVVRQTKALYMGLEEADRKRRMVLKWTKAEGHVGEMSDGEDWVDKEEWGLTEDLVKGKEEEDEEGVAQSKKTRARRREEK